MSQHAGVTDAAGSGPLNPAAGDQAVPDEERRREQEPLSAGKGHRTSERKEKKQGDDDRAKKKHSGATPQKSVGAGEKRDDKQGKKDRKDKKEKKKMLKALMDDAPEGHAAYSKVHCHTAKKNFYFNCPLYAGTSREFLVTAGGAGGSSEMAARIARLCFVRYEEGVDRDELTRWRNRLYELCEKARWRQSSAAAAADGDMRKPEAPGAPGAPEAGSGEVEPGAAQSPRTKRKRREESTNQAVGPADAGCSAAVPEKGVENSAASAAPQGAPGCDPGATRAGESTQASDQETPGREPRGGEAAPASDREDAPPGSKAHAQVTRKGGQVFYFVYKGADGQNFRVQTTTRKAGDSEADAARICRLCYVRAEAGASKAEVESFRNELYEKLRASRGPTHPRAAKPKAPAATSPAAAAQTAPCAAKGAAAAGERKQQTTAVPAEVAAASPARRPRQPAGGGRSPEAGATGAQPAGSSPADAAAAAPRAPGSSSTSTSSSGSSSSSSDSEDGGKASKDGKKPKAAQAAARHSAATPGARKAAAAHPPADSRANKRPRAGGAASSTARQETARSSSGGGNSAGGSSGATRAASRVQAGGATIGVARERLSQPQLEARRQLEGELQALTRPEALKSPASIPDAVTRIFDVFVNLMGWAHVFCVMADAFNAAERGGGGESSRRVLMYVWHEILDYSHYTNLYEVFSSGYDDFALRVKDAVAHAGGHERIGYGSLVDVWERRGFFEEQQAASIRQCWNLQPPGAGAAPLQ